jgi:phosphopantetheine adenylyltransferase
MADDIKIIIGVDATPVERAVRVMDNLEAEVRKVERAEKAGLITKERAKAETERLTASMQRLKVVANGSVSDFNKFEKGLYGSGKAARRNEVAFQQAGYQIQDFIVQVQGGTNPLIAFSQQGSQLAGFFAGPWGAAIGLGIAAVGALGTALMAAIGNVKSFEDQLKETTSSMEDYFSLLKENNEPFGDAFDKATEKLVKTSEAYKDLLAIAKIEAFDGITKLNESLTESVLSASAFKTEIQDTGDVINQGFAAKISAALGGRAGKDIRDFYNTLVQLREAPTLEAQYEAAVRAREIFKQNVDVTGELTDQQKQFWKELSTTIQKMELLGAATTAAKEAGVDQDAQVVAYQKEQLKFLERRQKVEEDLLKAQRGVGEEQVKLLQSQGKYTEATELAVKLAREEAEAKVLSSAENETQRRALADQATQAANLAEQAVRVAEQTRQTKEQTRMAKEEAQLLAKALREAASAMSALENIGVGVERQLAVAEAKAKALSTGANETVAGTVAAERFKVETAFWEAFEKATDPQAQEEAIRNYESTLGKIDRLEQTLADNAAKREAIREANKAATAAGKPNVSSLVESLLTEQEKVDAWREESLAKLQNFNALELEILGGHAEAKARIEQEYRNRVASLNTQKLNDMAGFFGAAASVTAAGGKKMAKVTATLQGAQAVMSAWSAYAQMLADPSFIGRPFARFAAAANVLAAGLNAVKNIKAAGSGGGASVSGAAATVPSTSEPQAQRVIVEGLDRNSLYSGEQLSNIFEALYKENKDRGFVFEVAR